MEEQFPIKYLGILLKAGRLNRSDWEPLFDAFEKKLEGWKVAMLLLGRKVVMLNAVLSSLPLYYVLLYITTMGQKEN